AGYFGTDREGNIVGNFGCNLRGYGGTNGVLEKKMGNLRVETSNREPKASSGVTQTLNLNSTGSVRQVAFDAEGPASYDSSPPTNIYDSQGNAHVLTQYFVKTGANSWDMNVLIDGRNPSAPLGDPAATPPTTGEEYVTTPLVFGNDGKLLTPATGTI